MKTLLYWMLGATLNFGAASAAIFCALGGGFILYQIHREEVYNGMDTFIYAFSLYFAFCAFLAAFGYWKVHQRIHRDEYVTVR